jgi:hypothetical protein
MSSSASAVGPDEREQQQKRARRDEDASVEQILTKMRQLADELHHKGVRVAVLGDGQIVPLQAGPSDQAPPTELPDGVLDCSRSDCLLIVPTSEPQPRYVYACAGELLTSMHSRFEKVCSRPGS